MQIHIAKNGQKMGPYSEAQVREMLAAGSVAGTDLGWHEGLADWVALSALLAAANSPAAPISPMVPRVAVIDPNLADRGARLGAVLLDCLILFGFLLPGLIVVWTGGDENDTIKAIAIVLIALGMLSLAVIQIYLLSTKGQTLGKKIVGVKIVKYADSSSPGFVHACLLRAIVPTLISNVPFLGLIFALVDICFIFGDERRCLHDLIAGTKVVNA
jgi:uncharacterized RDD family membrane protein YckC